MTNELDPRRGPPLFDGVSSERPNPPVTRPGLRETLRADAGRYIDLELEPSRLAVARALLANEGVWPLFAYRLGRWLIDERPHTRGPRRLLHALLWVVQFSVQTASRWLFDIRLDLRADIGPGFYVGHFKSIYVGPGVRIGRECNIGQMCFVSANGGPGGGAPVIGDRVYLGVGSKVLGPLRIGSDVALGANTVPFEDVPDMAVVVGNPARVVSLKGSEDFISIKKRDGAPGSDRRAPVPEKPSGGVQLQA